MAKKINLSGVKDFLFNHGEKVALGACAFLALLFATLGLVRALSANRADDGSNLSWVDALKARHQKIQSDMGSAQKPVLPKRTEEMMDPNTHTWGPMPSIFVMTPYNSIPENANLKRLNPQALGIRGNLPDGPKNIQIDYISGIALVHEYETNVVKGLGYANAPETGPLPILPKDKKKKKDEEIVSLPPYLPAGRPVRMAVITGQFPMKKQLEEFQKALKFATQKEMFVDNRDDLPRVIGLNVIRYELVNGKPTKEEGEILVGIDRDGKLVKSKALDDLLRDAIYDDQTPILFKEYLYAGLITPMPKLANAQYPRFTFPGFDIAFDDDVERKPDNVVAKPPPVNPMKDPLKGFKNPMKMPPMPQPMEVNPGLVGGDRTVKDITLKMLRANDPALAARLFPKDGKNAEYNIFHVLGLEAPPKDPDAKEQPKASPGMPPPGMGKAPPVMPRIPNMGIPGIQANDLGAYFHPWDIDPPVAPQMGNLPEKNLKKDLKTPMPMGLDATAYPPWERDALVRFIDPGVEPGKTYSYAIQVRLANPNFGKKDLVEFANLANVEELVSNWEYTQSITIPQEYFLYAVDQHLVDDWAALAGEKPARFQHPRYFKDDDRPVAKDKKPTQYNPKQIKDHTSFQIHKWTKTAASANNRGEMVIGDWAIAEQITVRRGDSIGLQAHVRVPIWVKEKEAFDVPHFKEPKDTKKSGLKLGLRMDMKSDAERPVLVDFTGGKRLTPTNTLDEETLVEALIMTPDGKLTVLNSRADTIANDRQSRVVSIRNAVEKTLNQDFTPDPKGMK